MLVPAVATASDLLSPPEKGAQQPLLFGPCLWPNGRPSQLLLSTCNGVIVSSKWCGGSIAQFVND